MKCCCVRLRARAGEGIALHKTTAEIKHQALSSSRLVRPRVRLGVGIAFLCSCVRGWRRALHQFFTHHTTLRFPGESGISHPWAKVAVGGGAPSTNLRRTIRHCFTLHKSILHLKKPPRCVTSGVTGSGHRVITDAILC